MSSLQQMVRLIVLLQSVFGESHEDFLNNDWTFIGTVNRFCTSELLCGGGVPSCDSSTDGTTVQDRIDINNCVAQGCESGTQWSRNTYYCEASRKQEFIAKGWSYIGNHDRFCSSELDCTGTIPYCDSSTNGKTVQDRSTVNGCIAQGCEQGNQWYRLTYYCATSTSLTSQPSNEPIAPSTTDLISSLEPTLSTTADSTFDETISKSTIFPIFEHKSTVYQNTEHETKGNPDDIVISDTSASTLDTNTLIIIAVIAVVVLGFIGFCYRNYAKQSNKEEKHSSSIDDEARVAPAPQSTQIIVVQPVNEPLITPSQPSAPSVYQSSGTTQAGRCYENISNWMTNTVGFAQYIDNFVLNGYDSLEIIMDIENAQELEDIGITLKGHQVRIIKQISLLRKHKSVQKKQDNGQTEGGGTVPPNLY